MARIKRQDLLKFVYATIIISLTSIAQIDGQIKINMSAFIAWTFCHVNFMVISPLYITSCLFYGLTIETFIYAISPIVVLSITKFIQRITKRELKIYLLVILQIISFIPIFFINKQNPLLTIAEFTINIILVFVYSSVFYAIFVRKSIINLSIDEKACAYILIAILSLGLYTIKLFTFRPYYVFLGFLIMYLLDKHRCDVGLYIISAISLGCGLYHRDVGVVGAIIVIYLIARVFKKINKFLAAVSIPLSTVAFGIYFTAFMNFHYFHLIAITIGLLIYVLLPKKVTSKFFQYTNNEYSICANNLIKRDKFELIKKLNTAESVIYEMAEGFIPRSSAPTREEDINRLSKDAVLQTCEICVNREQCFKSLNISPKNAIRDLIDAAIIKGSITQKDLPVSINTRCKNVPKLLSIINSVIKQYVSKIENEKNQQREDRLLSMQMAGIGSIIGSITTTLKEFPTINEKLDELLKAELGYNNIWCQDALFLSTAEKNMAVVVVKKSDKDNIKINNILNKILNDKLYKKDEDLTLDQNLVCLFYESTPRFDIAFANIIMSKDGSMYSGDSHAVVKIKDNKILLILCDGMGSGEKAQIISRKTISLVEDFYKARLDNSKSLLLINRALACINKENFAAVDMCVVDLNSGTTDFIKLGAVPSFIRRKEGVQIVSGCALPLGIIDTARPNVNREILTSNDMTLLISDGIFDVLKSEGIKEILSRLNNSNPKMVCNEIIGQAKNIGLFDDASVIAFKIYEKV